MEVTIVAFDFDETLTVRDTFVPFMRIVSGRTAFVKICIRNFTKIVVLMLKNDRNSVKDIFVSEIFTGREVKYVEQMGNDFAIRIIHKFLRTDTIERMRWHQEEGHVVVVVSASLGVYLHAVGDLLEVDAVLCTELQNAGGIFTGFVEGTNCRGEEKVERIRTWMRQAGCAEETLQYAYGDSGGDEALLNFAQSGTNVRSKDLLRTLS